LRTRSKNCADSISKRSTAPRPRLHAFEAHLHWHVEQDRAVGIQVAVHGMRDLVDELAIDSASTALVSMGRIR
jgi:hypothetical protein